MIGAIRRWYGAHPLHLLALLAAFALAGYAVHAVVAAGQWRGFAVWFAVAIVGHDLLLFPLYALADLSLQRLLPGWVTRRPSWAATRSARAEADAARPGPPPLNYLRIPALFSLLLLMAFFPLILGLSQGAYHAASGLGTRPYLWRWLGVTGAMFAVSAVAYAWRTRRAGARARAAAPGPRAVAPGPPPDGDAPVPPPDGDAPVPPPDGDAPVPPPFDAFTPRPVDPGSARSRPRPGSPA